MGNCTNSIHQRSMVQSIHQSVQGFDLVSERVDQDSNIAQLEQASPKPPRVSIGLPVYNGERFLAETLDSILGQTFADFELIISDNDSTDATPVICTEYAAREPRIRFFRSSENRGAAWNYNRVFELSRAEYFKWAAADDLLAPEFLDECVQVLDSEPDVAVVFPRCRAIDDDSRIMEEYPSLGNVASSAAHERFAAMALGFHPFVPVFGLIRRRILANTKLIGKYSGSDRPLVGELALRGRMVELPDFLFEYRVHAQQSWGSGKSHHQQQAWYDPTRLGRITFPHWRLLGEHEHTVWRAADNWKDFLMCQGVMLHWIRSRWRFLASNLILRDLT